MLVIFLAILGIISLNSGILAQNVYVASSQEHYLQMTLLVDDDTCVLYNLDSGDERLSHFCNQVYPKGKTHIVIVTDALVNKQWKKASRATAVLIECKELSSKVIDTEIARQLEEYVYFSKREFEESNFAGSLLVQIGGLKEKTRYILKT